MDSSSEQFLARSFRFGLLKMTPENSTQFPKHKKRLSELIILAALWFFSSVPPGQDVLLMQFNSFLSLYETIPTLFLQ